MNTKFKSLVVPLFVALGGAGCGATWGHTDLGRESERSRQTLQFWVDGEDFKLHALEFFEDSVVGVQSARAAGCKVCGVRSSLSAKKLGRAGASWTIEDFEDETSLSLAFSGQAAKRGPAAVLRGWLGRA